ncbi:hypothetical protein ARTHRO9V_160267 [Arthrobacter sp. 9V]|nr:hypothetical protein ARTHRO9V_160267 [Arthrobacter sp. 9V]
MLYDQVSETRSLPAGEGVKRQRASAY